MAARTWSSRGIETSVVLRTQDASEADVCACLRESAPVYKNSLKVHEELAVGFCGRAGRKRAWRSTVGIASRVDKRLSRSQQPLTDAGRQGSQWALAGRGS